MTQTMQISRVDSINGKIDKSVAGGIGVNPSRGLVVQSIDQAMELAKMMAVSDMAVPKHLRGNPGACLAIAVQGYEWAINPFALANKSYVVNDRLAYESALYHAVVQRRAPIKGRIKSSYAGKELTRTCKVWATLDDGSNDVLEYTSPELAKIPPQNSPLWKGDPDQQLFYYSVREFARRHFPDVMMGIYTVDELQEAPKVESAAPQSRTSALLDKINSGPVDTGQTLEANPEILEQAATEGVDMVTGEVIEEPADVDTDHQQPEAPEVAPVPQIPEPQSLISHKELIDAMNEAAMELGVSESTMLGQLAKAIPDGKQNKTTPAERRRIWREFVDGTGFFAR